MNLSPAPRPWRPLVAAACLSLAFGGAPAAAQSFESGPYLGLGLGGGQLKDTLQWGPDWRYEDPDDWDGVPSPHTHTVKKSGMLGGVYGGYNWRVGQWILGIEGDASGSSIKRTETIHSDVEDGFEGRFDYKYRMPWLLTLRPRVGFVIGDSFMLYGTAGLAVAKVKMSLKGEETDLLDGSRNALDYSQSDTMHGWVAGAGFEYAISESWHLRGEYLHADFKKAEYDFSVSDADGTSHLTGQHRPKLDMFRVGVSYQF